MAAPKLPFVQLELAGTIGLDEGRFLARDEGEVLVVRLKGAAPPPRRRIRKAKPKDVEPAPSPSPVAHTVLTAISAARKLETAGEGAAWLERLRADEEALGAEVARALRFMNRALHAHRIAALDPWLADVSVAHALAVRVGYGEGEGLAEGSWEAAVELPGPERRKRIEALAPQERIAAALAGRERPDAATGALLRARADLDAGRLRDAALQLRVGLEALLADRESFGGEGQERDLAALAERRPATGEAADEALAGELTDARAAELAETLRLCERVLRRRRAYG